MIAIAAGDNHSAALKADGKVTPAERNQLRKDQNKASRDIYRKKHNEKERSN